MRTIAFTLLLLIGAMPSMADERVEAVCFSGTVTNQDGNPVGGACVSLRCYGDEAKTIVAEYTAESGADGRYSVSVEQPELTYIMSVSAPGYARYVADIPFRLGKDVPVWNLIPPGEITLFSKLEFFAGRQATILLPDAPDPSWGRYYKPSRLEGATVIFEREAEPQANVPYVIFPAQDFTIDMGGYDFDQLPEAGVAMPDDVEPNGGLGLLGTYQSCYVWMTAAGCNKLLDSTPDCIPGTPDSPPRLGAFRAYLRAHGSSINTNEARIVFADEQTGIEANVSRHGGKNELTDLQGRRLKNTHGKGVYIKNGRKHIVR